MRNAFCQSLVEAARRPEFVFLTGDLGFKALEPLRDALGPRFINAGVAEQNMVSVAAGLASRGPSSLGLQHRAVRLRPAVRADPQRRLPASAAGGPGRQRRRLRLRRDGCHAPRARGLRRAALPAAHARLCSGVRRTTCAAQVEKLFCDRRTRPTCGWGSREEPQGCGDPRLRRLAEAPGRTGLAGARRRAAGRRHLGAPSGCSQGAIDRRVWVLSELPC